ncbi:MAG TPA: sigma-70 family RNA polymerase sigma factor [Prolixibacteraceae bacterium]|nr:sigma-70 family RNA polymerase sigma factor [Prolixibacteraceae bacterium]
MSESLKNRIIWNEFRKGNKEALEIIYEDNYASLYNYGIKFSNDNGLIKDLIHELFIELINSGSKLSNTDNIRFYLLKALRNKLLKQLSENSKFTNKFEESTGFNLIDSIESQLIKEEIEQQLHNQIITAINKLSLKQQEIVYLRFYNDISYLEIAALFDVNIQTVRNLMNRAINSLKEDLRNNNYSKHLILFVLSLSI